MKLKKLVGYVLIGIGCVSLSACHDLYVEDGYYDGGYYDGGYYGGDDGYYFIDYCNGNAALDTYETYAQSEEEAVGIFLIEHPDLCFGDVIEVYGDYENYKIDAWR